MNATPLTPIEVYVMPNPGSALYDELANEARGYAKSESRGKEIEATNLEEWIAHYRTKDRGALDPDHRKKMPDFNWGETERSVYAATENITYDVVDSWPVDTVKHTGFLGGSIS